MNQINCPICGKKCVKSGKTNAGSQRWLCKACKSSFTHKIDNNSKELKSFLEWLFGKEAQSTMPGEGRSFRRKMLALIQKTTRYAGGKHLLYKNHLS